MPTFETKDYGGGAGLWVCGPDHIDRWDGSSWKSFSVPTGYYRNLYGTDSNHVWCIKDEGQIWHWDGRAWAAQFTARQMRIKDLWGSSAADVWAVGTYGIILHYDGQAWSYWNVADESFDFAYLYVFGDENKWATSYLGERVYQGDRTGWHPVPGIHGKTVSAFDPANVWVNADTGYLWHSNGAQWEHVPFEWQGTPMDAGRVYAPLTKEVYVLGWLDSNPRVLLRRSETGWEEVPVPLPRGESLVGDLWGVGGAEFWVSTTVGWASFDGVRWSFPDVPWYFLAGHQLDNIWFWGIDTSSFFRFDGSILQEYAFPPNRFWNVDSAHPSECYVDTEPVNQVEFLGRWDGHTLEPVAQAPIYEVASIRENEVYILGGTFIRRGYCRGGGRYGATAGQVLAAGYGATTLVGGEPGTVEMFAIVERANDCLTGEDIQVSIEYQGLPTGVTLASESPPEPYGLYTLNVPVAEAPPPTQVLLEVTVRHPQGLMTVGRRWPCLEVSP